MIDAHHHLWDPTQAHYPWLDHEEAAPVRRRFDAGDLAAVTDGLGVEGTVVIEARHSLDETRALMAIAAGSDLVSGVVGWADLGDPALEDVLAKVRAEPGGDRLAGVRVELDAHDPDWLGRPDVLRGLRTLAAAGLTYDLLAGPRELTTAARALSEVPELTVVVDHLGKPDVESSLEERWTAPMAALGRLPNVWCKVSGGFAPAFRPPGPDVLVPFVAHVREWFGDTRLIFGSDWPVCTLAASYPDVLHCWQQVLSDLGPAQQEATFGGNARRVYHLH